MINSGLHLINDRGKLKQSADRYRRSLLERFPSFNGPSSQPRHGANLKKDTMKNIYVGNLDFKITEDDLRQAFAAYGQVDKVTILKDRDTGQPRGFGFVEMTNDEEAEKAIHAMNGAQLGSRALNVNEARPKTSKAGFGGGRGGGGGRGYGNRY